MPFLDDTVRVDLPLHSGLGLRVSAQPEGLLQICSHHNIVPTDAAKHSYDSHRDLVDALVRRLGIQGATLEERLAAVQARLRAELEAEYGQERVNGMDGAVGRVAARVKEEGRTAKPVGGFPVLSAFACTHPGCVVPSTTYSSLRTHMISAHAITISKTQHPPNAHLQVLRRAPGRGGGGQIIVQVCGCSMYWA